MSYYTYFKPSEDYIKAYQDVKTVEKQLKEAEDTKQNDKTLLILWCVYAHQLFNQNNSQDKDVALNQFYGASLKIKELYYYIKSFVYSYVRSQCEVEMLSLHERVLEDEDHEFYFNHFQYDKWDLQNTIDDFDSYIKDYVKDLCVHCIIRFKADDRYSDTPKTEEDYLKTDFQDKINDIFEGIDELCSQYETAKALLLCYDTKENEDERYNKKKAKEENIEEPSKEVKEDNIQDDKKV